MSPLKMLEKPKQAIVEEMIHALAKISGVEAIVLGGSYARGVAKADSDIDLGVYYFEKTPPSINKIKELAVRFDRAQDSVVSDYYEWGPWVNGGAWLNTKGGKVDWLYRNIDQVERVIEEAHQGRFAWDYRQQPPHGFFSVMYLADIRHHIILHDPKGICARLGAKVQEYPEALRRAIIQEHLWSVEFSFVNAKKFANRGCVYGTIGCLTRMAAELTQVLFALNRDYFVSEKGAMDTIETFAIKPREFGKKLKGILSHPGEGERLIASLEAFEGLIREVIALAEPIYQPKYIL